MASMHFSLYVAFLCFISCLVCCVGDCSLSSCFSRKEEFTECSNTGTVTKGFVYLTFANISSNAWLDSQSLVPLILSLLCNERRIQWGEQQVPPYCALMNVIGSRNCSNDTCSNCAQFSLYIGDQWNANDTEGSVSSSLIDGVLSMESSRIALALAGFVYIRNSTQTEGNPVMSAAVPLVSWICLILGVVVSSVILFKPIWWDRGLKKLKTSGCCKR